MAKKILTEEEKLAKKKHIKEEIQAYACMILFIVLFILIFAMFGAQSTIFGRWCLKKWLVYAVFWTFEKILKNFEKSLKKVLTKGKWFDIIIKLTPRETAKSKRTLKIEQQIENKELNPCIHLSKFQSNSKVSNDLMLRKRTDFDLFKPLGAWIYKHYQRVWSWLRTNAGGAPNTCKSNERRTSVQS